MPDQNNASGTPEELKQTSRKITSLLPYIAVHRVRDFSLDMMSTFFLYQIASPTDEDSPVHMSLNILTAVYVMKEMVKLGVYLVTIKIGNSLHSEQMMDQIIEQGQPAIDKAAATLRREDELFTQAVTNCHVHQNQGVEHVANLALSYFSFGRSGVAAAAVTSMTIEMATAIANTHIGSNRM